MGVPAAQGQRRAREERQEAPNWGVLPPELLRDVLARVEGGDAQWPSRRNVVAAAGVCRAWRDISWDLAAASSSEAACSPLTFPQHLRQAGPRDKCIECFIRRSRKTGIYTLYLGLPPTPTENGKFLMAARKCGWRPSCTEYIISLDPHTYSRTSSAYLGRLRANFLSTKFTIFDSSHPVAQPSGASSVPAAASNNSPSWGAGCVSPPRGSQPAAPVVSVAYALNVLGTRGPRRIQCTLHGVASEEDSVEGMAIHTGCAEEAAEHLEGGAVPVASGSAAVASRSRGAVADCSASVGDCGCVVCNGCVPSEPLVLKNKPPRWHEQLQCWCLNFRGRVTVASVKNFQLVECGGASDADKPVLLQFGKIGKDTFTMDYRYPLSAFQAFAICLSSFDTKVACE